MKIAIYDIESTGAITEWSSIIEIGGVLIDENFKEIDRFNLRGRIPEGEIPQAKALLVNGTTIDQLTKSNLSNYMLLDQVEKHWGDANKHMVPVAVPRKSFNIIKGKVATPMASKKELN